MKSRAHTLDDFKIGERVVPKNAKNTVLEVVSLDYERRVIICRLPTERSVQAYFPHELEKEIGVKPNDIMDKEMPADG